MQQKNTKKQKDALVIILQTLIPYRDQAEGFLEIVKNTENEELENKLINVIYQQIKSIKSKKEIKNIKENIVKAHKNYEYKEKKDKEDAEQLLDNFINNIS